MLQPITPTRITAYTATSALGQGKAAMRAAVQEAGSGLQPLSDADRQALSLTRPLTTWVGGVEGLDVPLPEAWSL